jgi:hypothetical protein
MCHEAKAAESEDHHRPSGGFRDGGRQRPVVSESSGILRSDANCVEVAGANSKNSDSDEFAVLKLIVTTS